MSARISTILILGATRGIGEALARRFHSLGKKVIITGRGQDHEKIHQLARDLPGLEFRIWDLADLSALQTHVKDILTSYPQLDTIFLNAAIQPHYSLFTSPPFASCVVTEITTNLTAPILVAHSFAPYLLSLAKLGTNPTIFITTSSLAYFPVLFYPTYCATKAGLASFTKILRMQLLPYSNQAGPGSGPKRKASTKADGKWSQKDGARRMDQPVAAPADGKWSQKDGTACSSVGRDVNLDRTGFRGGGHTPITHLGTLLTRGSRLTDTSPALMSEPLPASRVLS